MWTAAPPNKPSIPRHSQPPANQDRPYREVYNPRAVEQPQVQASAQWHNIPTSAVSVAPYPHSAQTPILFAAHPASMPIPVPMPGAHQHAPTMMIPQQAYGQPHMQATLTYPAQAIAMQSAAGYPPGVGNPQMPVEAQSGMGLMHVIGPEEYMGMQPH